MKIIEKYHGDVWSQATRFNWHIGTVKIALEKKIQRWLHHEIFIIEHK